MGTGMVTLQEASRRLCVSRATLYRWSRQGRLRLFQVGPRATRVREEDLRALEEAAPHDTERGLWSEAREVDLLEGLREIERESADLESYLRELGASGTPVRWDPQGLEFQPLDA